MNRKRKPDERDVPLRRGARGQAVKGRLDRPRPFAAAGELVWGDGEVAVNPVYKRAERSCTAPNMFGVCPSCSAHNKARLIKLLPPKPRPICRHGVR